MVGDWGLDVGASLGDRQRCRAGCWCSCRGRRDPGRRGRERDAVAGVKFANDAGIFEPVRHDDWLHEAGDVFAVECDVGSVGGEDLPRMVKVFCGVEEVDVGGLEWQPISKARREEK